MKTLLFNGSPRPAGDTARLIAELTGALNGDVLEVDCYRCGIQPCWDCRHCWTHSDCQIQDGMQPVYHCLEACEAVVIASPIYFSELTGPLLSVLSRLQRYYCNRVLQRAPLPVRPKRGGLILVGGGDGSMERARQTAVTLLHQMNATQILPPVCFHLSNVLPASEAPELLQAVRQLAHSLEESL